MEPPPEPLRWLRSTRSALVFLPLQSTMQFGHTAQNRSPRKVIPNMPERAKCDQTRRSAGIDLYHVTGRRLQGLCETRPVGSLHNALTNGRLVAGAFTDDGIVAPRLRNQYLSTNRGVAEHAFRQQHHLD